ncbi:MAG: short-chain dehydrogenase/reductase, partial [Anaerocolumna sp.]|nr:short-chain dehydrogenase/reductase [Anaerocolumna sp.]
MIIENKVAIITGGGTGIGKHTCLKLAEHGVKIVLNYLNSEMDALDTYDEIKKLGGDAFLVRADVSKDQEVREMIQKVVAYYGNIHFLINNASITKQIEL